MTYSFWVSSSGSHSSSTLLFLPRTCLILGLQRLWTRQSFSRTTVFTLEIALTIGAIHYALALPSKGSLAREATITARTLIKMI